MPFTSIRPRRPLLHYVLPGIFSMLLLAPRVFWAFCVIAVKPSPHLVNIMGLVASVGIWVLIVTIFAGSRHTDNWLFQLSSSPLLQAPQLVGKSLLTSRHCGPNGIAPCLAPTLWFNYWIVYPSVFVLLSALSVVLTPFGTPFFFSWCVVSNILLFLTRAATTSVCIFSSSRPFWSPHQITPSLKRDLNRPGPHTPSLNLIGFHKYTLAARDFYTTRPPGSLEPLWRSNTTWTTHLGEKPGSSRLARLLHPNCKIIITPWWRLYFCCCPLDLIFLMGLFVSWWILGPRPRRLRHLLPDLFPSYFPSSETFRAYWAHSGLSHLV